MVLNSRDPIVSRYKSIIKKKINNGGKYIFSGYMREDHFITMLFCIFLLNIHTELNSYSYILWGPHGNPVVGFSLDTEHIPYISAHVKAEAVANFSLFITSTRVVGPGSTAQGSDRS